MLRFLMKKIYILRNEIFFKANFRLNDVYCKVLYR